MATAIYSHENGELFFYGNQFRFLDNNGGSEFIYGKTPLSILKDGISEGKSASELKEIGRQYKIQCNSLLRIYDSRNEIIWGNNAEGTRIIFGRVHSREQGMQIIAYLKNNYPQVWEYSKENHQYLKENIGSIKLDVKSQFDVDWRVKKDKNIPKSVETSQTTSQTTFNLGDSEEVENLRKQVQHFINVCGKLKQENRKLKDSSNSRYSNIEKLYIDEIKSLKCNKCGAKLVLKVNKGNALSRNKGIVYYGCEGYQFNGHSDCREQLQINGVVYAIHQKDIDDFLAQPHRAYNKNTGEWELIENVRLPYSKEYYEKYLKEFFR